MPDYKIKDPTTGRTITLRGGSPPTEQELENIFSQQYPVEQVAPKTSNKLKRSPSEFIGDFVGAREEAQTRQAPKGGFGDLMSLTQNIGMDISNLPMVPLDIGASKLQKTLEPKNILPRLKMFGGDENSLGNIGTGIAEIAKFPFEIGKFMTDSGLDLLQASQVLPIEGIASLISKEAGLKAKQQKEEAQKRIFESPIFTTIGAMGLGKGIKASTPKNMKKSLEGEPIQEIKVTPKDKVKIVSTEVKEVGKLEKIKNSVSGKPTSEANAVAKEIVRDRTGNINYGESKSDLSRKRIDKAVKEIVKEKPMRDRIVAQIKGKGLGEQIKEDMIFYRQKTGNPLIKGDTFETLSKRLPNKAKGLTNNIGKHLDMLWEKINEDDYMNSKSEKGGMPYLENYITQMYIGSKDRVQRVAGNLVRQFPFGKKRKWEDYHEAITKGGLEMRYKDIGQIVQYYENMVSRVSANNEMVKNFKDMRTNDGKAILYTAKDIPAELRGEYREISHPIFNRLYTIKGKEKEVKKISSVKEDIKTEQTSSKKSTATETTGGQLADLADSGPKAKLETVMRGALEDRGFTEAESANFIRRLKGQSKESVENVIEIIKTETVTNEKLKTITKSQVEKIIKERAPDIPISTRSAWVHKEVAEPLLRVLDTGFDMSGKWGTAITTVNAVAKKAMLSASFFHHLALTESAFATGNWNIIGSLSRGKALLANRDGIAKDAIKAGLKVDATNDIHLNTVNKLLDRAEVLTRKIPLVHQGVRAFRWTNKKWDHMLWDSYHRNLKMDAYYDIYTRNLKKFPNTNPKQVAREAANFVNDAFGGQNWDGYLKPNFKKGEQIAQLIWLAPDWSLSNLKIAARGVGALPRLIGLKGVGPKTVQGEALKYWARAGSMFTIGQQMAQYGFYQANGDSSQSQWMWDNPPEHKFSVKTYTKDEKGRDIYIKPLKQAREVLRYFSDTVEILGSKLSPLLRETIEQLTGSSPGSGFDQPYKHMEGWDGAWERIKSVASKPIPLSFKGSSFAFSLPKSTGMNNYRTQELFVESLRKYSERESEQAFNELDMIRLHSDDNNLETKRLFSQSLSILKGRYYSDLFGAINKGDMVEAEKLAVYLKRLDADPRYVERSMQRRFDKLLKENGLKTDEKEIQKNLNTILDKLTGDKKINEFKTILEN